MLKGPGPRVEGTFERMPTVALMGKEDRFPCIPQQREVNQTSYMYIKITGGKTYQYFLEQRLLWVELCPLPPNFYVEAVTPSTTEDDFIGKEDLFRGNKVKMSSLGWGPRPIGTVSL